MHQIARHDAIANRILRALPQSSLQRIWPELERVDLPRGQVIDREDRLIANVYFVNRGLVSLVKTMQDGRTVEIGAIGIEGITDPLALFGITTAAMETIVQIPGTAFRIGRAALRKRMAEDEVLRALLEKYARFAVSQLGQTAACNRLHSLEERCCRWLLMAHDSALSDTFLLTHEFLAMMLGTQRSGVSIAARFLQKAGLIDYKRGQVTIVNRAGLEDAACECYATMRGALDKLLRAPKEP